jgi:GTP-binding protein LepA
MDTSHIRNFCIVAHIDHGKSTLAEKLLSDTGSVSTRERESGAQFLDTMDLEQERGITIKARTVRLRYRADNGEDYYLNLIDTPGHVDFSYEVSRSLSACEGAILVVDATQGVEAQTLANTYLALDHHLELLPVINKIDLPSAEPERVRQEIEDIIGLDGSTAILASAKEGLGIHEVLEGIVRTVPSPDGDANAPLKALLFDSWFDSYQGAVILVRVFEGTLHQGMTVQLMSSDKLYDVQRLGVFAPRPMIVDALGPGEVGFVMAGIKDVTEARIGDTITDPTDPTAAAFPGFKEVKPMVFAGLYPVDSVDYDDLRDAVEKLRLNDASFTYVKESSLALGFGFRCGFLGLLHMEIVQERLEREFGLDLITTTPTVEYRVVTITGESLLVDNPAMLPPEQEIDHIEEPFILATIHVPTEYLGNVLQLCQERRGVQRELKYPGINRALVLYELPLNEVVIDFHDRLKSVSRGYASFDYDYLDLRPAKLLKLDIRINGELVDALSLIVHQDQSYARGRELTQKMRELIPRQMYDVAIQASVGGRIIARETVKALRKNVTAKCYGGDITRKRKLLEKQKEGKRRMKQVGRVEIPQEAFLALLRVRDA